MKILHTADWHIGQTLRNYDREDEQRHFIAAITRILAEETPDAMVVCGDVFHSALPTIGAQQLLVDALAQMHDASPLTRIIIIAGNHDSGSRLEIHRQLWRSLNVHIIGRCDPERSIIALPDGKGTVIAVPYVNRVQFADNDSDSAPAQKLHALFGSLLRSVEGSEAPVVLCAHLALQTSAKVAVSDDTNPRHTEVTGGLEVRELSSVPDGYDYLALGHIHFPHSLSERAAYSGSPMPMTFDEDNPHYVNIVEIASRGAVPEIRRVAIAPLRGVRTLKADSVDEALAGLAAGPDDCTDYVRSVIDTADLLPADIDDRARRAVAGKQCRFCGCSLKPRSAPTVAADDTEMEIEEFLRIDPLDVARRYFKDEQVEDAESLLNLLSGVIDSLRTEPEK